MDDTDGGRPVRFALPPSLGPERLVPSTARLRRVLEAATGREVDVTVSQSYEVLLRNLLSGAVDAAHAPPFVCAQAEPQGIRVVARVVRRGRSTYGAALIARADRKTTLRLGTDLKVAWVDRSSVAGHLLAKAYLRKRGLPPESLFAEERFLGSYEAAVRALLDGDVDVASVHAIGRDERSARDAVELVAPGQGGDVEILAMTDEVPSDAVVARDERTATLIARAFLSMPKDVVDEVFTAERFEPAPPMGYRALYHLAPRDLSLMR
jgi:phosphonate transport system substrate-binding protein